MAQTIDDLMDRSLIHVLDRNGHGIHFRHPHTNEAAEVAHAANRKDADKAFRKLRRIMAGIFYAVAEQARKGAEKS